MSTITGEYKRHNVELEDLLGPADPDAMREAVESFEAIQNQSDTSAAQSFYDGLNNVADGQLAQSTPSVMQAIQPNRNFDVSASTSDLRSNATLADAGLKGKMDVTQGAKQEVDAAQNDFVATFKEAQGQFSEMMAEVAEEKGYNAREVLQTIAPQQQSTELGAVLTATGEAIMPGGAAFAVIGSVFKEMNDEQKSEVLSIAEEAQSRLLHQQKQQRLEVATGQQQEEPEDPNRFQWENLTPQQLVEDLVGGDPYQQPEMIALDQVEHDLEVVEEQQKVSSDRRFEATADKVALAVETDTVEELEQHADPEALATLVKGTDLEEEFDIPVRAEDVNVSSQSLAGIGGTIAALEAQGNIRSLEEVDQDIEDPVLKPSEEFIAEMKNGQSAPSIA